MILILSVMHSSSVPTSIEWHYCCLICRTSARGDARSPRHITDCGAIPNDEAMVAPRFLEPLSDKQAIDGQEIKMACRVAGLPMPKVSFFHDSKNIDEDEEFVITYDSETGEVR